MDKTKTVNNLKLFYEKDKISKKKKRMSSYLFI